MERKKEIMEKEMMKIAKNGAAIIGDVMVPAAEVRVLHTLVKLGQAATVPQIAKAMNDEMSDASLYSLLGRLAAQRGLVSRETVSVDVHGTPLRRVLWSAHQAGTNFFHQGDEYDWKQKHRMPQETAWRPA